MTSWHAYATSRAQKRPGAADITRHAVHDYAHLAGAPDAECGKPVAVYIGPWQPDWARNCARCAAAVNESPREGAA